MRALRLAATISLAILAWLAAPPFAQAQASASYTLSESSINAGGRPDAAGVASSASYRLTLDAIGDAALGVGLSSASYSAEGGLVAPHAPPGEVEALNWLSNTELGWSRPRSSTRFHVYRDDLALLSGLGYGACFASGLEAAQLEDTELPATGSARFYLVTAENRLGEEGTKGRDSAGTRRDGNVCP